MANMTNSNLDKLIEAERMRANARIAKLKRAAAAEQRKVDTKIIELLQEQKPDLYERIAHEASDALAAEKAKRSSRAKAAASASTDVPVESAPIDAGNNPEEAASWNG